MANRIRWSLWGGLVLAVVAFLSYYFVFARFPITRDVPWANFLLFAAALALVIRGWRQAPRKVLASIVGVLVVAIAGMFTWMTLFGSKGLPQSAGAPKAGSVAPAFTLPDRGGRPVSLAELLSQSNGVLLIFYRGYW